MTGNSAGGNTGRMVRDVVVYTLARLALVAALTLVIFYVAKAISVEIPLVVAMLFGIVLALPLGLGVLMIILTSITDILEVPDDLIAPVCIGAVLAGFVMPEVYIKNVTGKRREILNSVLPEGLDLLTICVEAGLSIDAAFRRVSREMQSSMPELAAEFEITAMELTYLPDRQQALENMSDRSDSPAMAALVNALRQTEKYGTPLAGSLRILSQEFRMTRQSKAEEKGARMPALMTVPLMVFILPTLVTVLLAPAIMSAFALT